MSFTSLDLGTAWCSVNSTGENHEQRGAVKSQVGLAKR